MRKKKISQGPEFKHAPPSMQKARCGGHTCNLHEEEVETGKSVELTGYLVRSRFSDRPSLKKRKD